MSGQIDNRDWTRAASYEMYSMQPTELTGKFLHDRGGAKPDRVIDIGSVNAYGPATGEGHAADIIAVRANAVLALRAVPSPTHNRAQSRHA